jgi:hypothetical protein
MVLTNVLVCAYHSIVDCEIILNDPGSISQGCDTVSCPDNGLRILARLIARDLVTRRQDNANKQKDREVSDPQILEDCR